MLIKLCLMKSQKISIILILIILIVFSFWPTSLYLANILTNFIRYIIPTIFIIISYILFKTKKTYYLIPLFLIPFCEPKLSILPIFAVCLDFVFEKKTTKFIIGLLVALIVFGFNFNSFKGETIFNKDYEAQQLIIRNIHLYQTPLLARIYQNKARTFIDKFDDNFFALTDPNNYFFAFHPREIPVKNQNLAKFPFLAIFLFLFGLFKCIKEKSNRYLFVIISSLLLSLSILTNFDRQDFILWFPLALIITEGVKYIINNFPKIYKYAFIIFILISIWELVRTIITFTII